MPRYMLGNVHWPAAYAAKVSRGKKIWCVTCEYTQERSLLFALIVNALSQTSGT